jgi:hypothetical protein
MPTFAADVLPDASGRNLGNSSQRWNSWLQTMNVGGTAQITPVAGQSINLGGAIYVMTSPITANLNTTAGQNLGVYTMPGGLLNALGKVLRGTIAGSYTTQAGQTPSLSLAVNCGSVQIFGITTPALVAGQSTCTWRAQWQFSVNTPGSAAMLDTYGVAIYATTSGSNTANVLIDAKPNPVGPVDLTAAEPIQVGIIFTTNTSPANICVEHQFILEVLN